MDQVTIVNMALAMLGDSPITSLTDATDRAALANTLYDPIRRAVLRAFPWHFAKKRVELSKETATPAFGWTNQFVMPADCLRILEPSDTNLKYAVEGRKILANESSFKIVYIKDEQDPVQFDSLFIDAFATRLASALATSIPKDRALAAQLYQLSILKLREARVVNYMEEPLRTVNTDTLTDVR